MKIKCQQQYLGAVLLSLASLVHAARPSANVDNPELGNRHLYLVYKHVKAKLINCVLPPLGRNSPECKNYFGKDTSNPSSSPGYQDSQAAIRASFALDSNALDPSDPNLWPGYIDRERATLIMHSKLHGLALACYQARVRPHEASVIDRYSCEHGEVVFGNILDWSNKDALGTIVIEKRRFLQEHLGST